MQGETVKLCKLCISLLSYIKIT